MGESTISVGSMFIYSWGSETKYCISGLRARSKVTKDLLLYYMDTVFMDQEENRSVSEQRSRLPSFVIFGAADVNCKVLISLRR